MQPSQIRVNGTELSLVEQGAGPPLVLVHGALQDYRFWLPHLEPFARHYRVIAYSRRGNYPHPAAPGEADSTGPVQGEDLAALIGALGLSEPRIVAHSAGAVAALRMAARSPRLARALVLCEPPASALLLPLADGAAVVQQFRAQVGEALRAFQSGDGALGTRLWSDALNGPGTWDGMPPESRAMMADNAHEMMGRGGGPPGAGFTAEDARRITAPVLLLRGEHSPAFFHRILDALQRSLGGPVASATIPGAGHTLQRANPAAFRAAVLSFLAQY